MFCSKARSGFVPQPEGSAGMNSPATVVATTRRMDTLLLVSSSMSSQAVSVPSKRRTCSDKIDGYLTNMGRFSKAKCS